MTEPTVPYLHAGSSGDGALPPLAHVFDRIEAGLASGKDMGLLYCCVLQQNAAEHGAAWQAYETMVSEIHAFLAGYRLERVWSVLRSQASWEIHTASITQEVVEFEGAMLLPGSVQFVTVHVVALHHAEVAADRSGAQALAD
jgi:hypothetical protein